MTPAKYNPGGISMYSNYRFKAAQWSTVSFHSKGKLFQTRGAATEKRRLPNIVLPLGL